MYVRWRVVMRASSGGVALVGVGVGVAIVEGRGDAFFLAGFLVSLYCFSWDTSR